jgi:hypothetical protein
MSMAYVLAMYRGGGKYNRRSLVLWEPNKKAKELDSRPLAFSDYSFSDYLSAELYMGALKHA